MSMEYLVERNQNGQILKFVGLGGIFFDVWGSDGKYLGTSPSVPVAHEMQSMHNCPEDCLQDLLDTVLKSS